MDLLGGYDSSSDSSEVGIGKVDIVNEKEEACFVRNQPHVTGNWAGSCFCRVSLNRHSVTEAVRSVCRLAEAKGYRGTCLQHDVFHVSLSRVFFLQESNITPFFEALEQRIRDCPNTRPFPIIVNSSQPAILHNDEGNRSFLTWPVCGQFRPLVRHCDEVLARYDQLPFYAPPLFHVSLASFAPALYLDLSSDISNEQLDGEANDDDDDDDSGTTISKVYCKFGTTKLFTISLA